MAANSSFMTVFQPSMPVEQVVLRNNIPEMDVDKDFEESRKNLIQMMTTTQTAITALTQLATQSQAPEIYDQLNKFIKTYNEQQEQLIRFYRIKASKEVQAQSQVKQANGATVTSEGNIDNRTQNVFVGTPADLARVLEGMKAKDIT
jgi:hypothetical protein